MNDFILTLEGVKGNWNILRSMIEKKIPLLLERDLDIANVLYHYVCCLIHENELEDALVIAVIGITSCRSESMKESYLNRIDDIEDLFRISFQDEEYDMYDMDFIEIREICKKHRIPKWIWAGNSLKEQILSA